MRRVSEIFETQSLEEANQKLKEGWRLHEIFGTPEKRIYEPPDNTGKNGGFSQMCLIP